MTWRIPGSFEKLQKYWKINYFSHATFCFWNTRDQGKLDLLSIYVHKRTVQKRYLQNFLDLSKSPKMLKILIVQEPQVVLYPSSVSFLTIFGTEKSNLKKSLTGGVGNWLIWTHFWISYEILVLKMGVCTQVVTLNDFQALRT